MRFLFELDAKNYYPDAAEIVRPSVRGILIKDGKIALVHSRKYDYYKFPGGGAEAGEDHFATLIREVREEAGLPVIPSSIRPYGMARRIERRKDRRFVQENYYYFCEAGEEALAQDLDGYEADEGFTLVWTEPWTAIRTNREKLHGPKSPLMVERESRVLSMLIEEGYFRQGAVSFESDYICGAHPDVLRRLVETNMETLSGYGTDPYSESAREKIRAAIGFPEADVEFLAGGTQANAVTISTMLKEYEGVIAAKTGHVSLHEAGAIEYTGHKVIELPEHDGKVDAGDLRRYAEAFYADQNHEHMVFPGMVYVSHPTEYGTLYSKRELTEIAAVCREYGMLLYLDGARLAYGLMSRDTDLSLPEIAELCDVFYIGGTKDGALCGEALVFSYCGMPGHFMTMVKRRGALAAKGRLAGVQFDALFTDGLYYKIGRHGIEMAERMKELFRRYGLTFYKETPTNQQFLALTPEQYEKLSARVRFSFWEELADGRIVVRFATSWSTTERDLELLEEALK